MIDNKFRYGRFTSSQIGDLMSLAKDGKSFGAPALSYIKAKGMERRLQRSIGNSASSRETSWGNLCEMYLFDNLGTKYNIVSKETIVHPEYPFWSGSPDGKKFGGEPTVYDAKCPFTLLSFCTFIDSWKDGGIAAIRKNHKSGNDYYWQLVSNAILTNSTHAELIIFCPYKRELDAIRLLAPEAPPDEAPQYNWLNYAYDKELPYLIEGAEYQSINIMRFEIPEADKDALTAAVIKAEALLNPQPSTILLGK